MKVKYSGKIIQVIEEEKVIPNTSKTKTFEYALRSPGVRALIVKGNKLLIPKEYRYELEKYDYRLPGGKVFDTLNEYKLHYKENLQHYAEEAVKKECLEEVGINCKNPKFLQVSKAGATVVWDLYYFEISDFTQAEQHLEEGELINYDWYPLNKVQEMCLSGEISEDRSVAVILKYILNKKTHEKNSYEKE